MAAHTALAIRSGEGLVERIFHDCGILCLNGPQREHSPPISTQTYVGLESHSCLRNTVQYLRKETAVDV